jgi:hypothetical protein
MNRFFQRIRAILRAESGAAGLYIALTAPVMFGATALAFDLARLMTLSTELQSAADAAALAGAAELNGQPGALARATTAASGAFGTNIQTFANDGLGPDIGVASIVFLSSLTAPDPLLTPPDAANPGGAVTTDDTAARFIRVVVETRSIGNTLIQLVGGPAQSNSTAAAVAGFRQTLCNVVPLMICNPLEANGMTDFNPPVGSQMLVRSRGAGAQWAPGVYGFVDPPENGPVNNPCVGNGNNQGTQDLVNFLATTGPTGCTSAGLNIRPGNPTPAPDGLNVRFDKYPKNGGQLGGNAKGNQCYAPAPNVTKGTVPFVNPKNGKSDACDPVAPANQTQAKALPRDNCLAAGNCSIGNLGNGQWDLAGYWAVNHGGAPPAGLTTRYDVYQYEIENNMIPQAGTPAGHVENGAPACYSGAPEAITPERRVLNVGIVNCIAQGVNGNAGNLTPIAILKGFITEPADDATGDIYVETVEVIRPNDGSGIVNTMVQLYR